MYFAFRYATYFGFVNAVQLVLVTFLLRVCLAARFICRA